MENKLANCLLCSHNSAIQKALKELGPPHSTSQQILNIYIYIWSYAQDVRAHTMRNINFRGLEISFTFV